MLYGHKEHSHGSARQDFYEKARKCGLEIINDKMMKQVDINAKYRQVAIYCAVHGGKNDGRAHITWEEQGKRFGISWETYTHELHVKGMLFGASGYEYLRSEWAAMTPAERMERIKEMYPYPWQERQ